MIKEKRETVEFKGIDIFNKEFMIKLISLFNDSREVVLKTPSNTLQIKLHIEDFLNPNHAIRQVLAVYPDADLLLSKEKIVEEFFDVNDPFVCTYIRFANNWEDNLRVPLSPLNDLFIFDEKVALAKV